MHIPNNSPKVVCRFPAVSVSLLALGLLSASPLLAGIVPNGVNLQPSYYNGGNPNLGFTLMNQNTKIQTCRIEIEPDKVSQAKSWISQARSAGKTVIATYHKASVLGSDSTSELNAAATWWKNNYATLHASGTFTVNLMNEWGSHNVSVSTVASAYNTAIGTVRQVYSGRIIIDCTGWGQETAIMAAALKGSTGPKINDTNITPAVHLYPGDWNQAKNHWLNTADLDDLNSGGRGGIVGEFGNGGSGSSDWSGCVDKAKSLGWSVIGWSWNGDGGSMNMCSPSWASNGGATSFTKSGYFNTVYNKL